METENTNEASEKYVVALTRNNKVVGYHLSDDQDVVKNASKAAIHNSWRQAEIEAGLNNDQWDLKSNEKFTVLPLSHAKTLKMSTEQEQSTEKLENVVRSVITSEASEKYVVALTRNNKVVGYHLSDDQDVVKNPSKAAIHDTWRQAEIEAGLNNDQWDLKSNEKFTVLPLSHAKTLKMST